MLKKITSLINKQTVFFSLSIFIMVVFAFTNIFRNEFVWDDYHYILGWTQIRAPMQNLSSLLRGEMPLGQGTAYRPIRSLYTAISYQFWGRDPLGYHLQAVLLHLGMVLLTFLLLHKLGCSRLTSFTAALFFSVHPLQVQSVTWITGSMDVIAYVFFFVSIYLYIANLKNNDKKLRQRSIIFAWLAFFSKEQTFILPLILFLYEILVHKTKKLEWKKILHSHRYYWFGLLAYVVIRTAIVPHRAAFASLIDPAYGSPILSIILFFWYFRLMVWPTGLAINHNLGSGISSFYREDVTQLIPLGNLFNVYFFLGLILIILSIKLIFLLKKNNPISAFLLAAAIVSFLPVIQLLPTNTIFWELYAYIPLFFFCGFMASVFWTFMEYIGKKWMFTKIQYVGLFVIIFVAVLFTVKTQEQNKVWATEISLWDNAVKITPASAKANHNLGLAYYRAGKTKKGITHLEKSVSLKPNDQKNVYGLLNAYLEQKQDDKFVHQINNMLDSSLDNRNVCFGVGKLLSQYNRLDLINKFQSCQISRNSANHK